MKLSRLELLVASMNDRKLLERIEIYKKSLEGRPNKALAEEYAISASTVCNILKGRNWEWLYGRYLELRSEYRVEKTEGIVHA